MPGLPESSFNDLNATFSAGLTALNSTVPAVPSATGISGLVKDGASAVWAAILAYILSLVKTSGDWVGHLMRDIFSQMVGTSAIGVIAYRYRHKLKEAISDVVNTVGHAVPEDWIDEQALVDLIEDAAGVDTPSGSEDEGEDTPLLLEKKKANEKATVGGKTEHQRKRAAKAVRRIVARETAKV